MLRIMMVIGFLAALVTGASAGPMQNLSHTVPAIETQRQIEKVACGHTDYFCPIGRYRACSPDGYCWCNRCGGANYWQRDPYYQYQGPAPMTGPGVILNFGGGGGDDRRYQRPYNGRCLQRGYTIQDGLCKPYTGR